MYIVSDKDAGRGKLAIDLLSQSGEGKNERKVKERKKERHKYSFDSWPHRLHTIISIPSHTFFLCVCVFVCEKDGARMCQERNPGIY